MQLFPLLRPLLFTIRPEESHGLTIAALCALPRLRVPDFDPALMISIAGIDFPSPVGLAAGFDKDAKAMSAMLSLGFGSVEVGTLTPRPQVGNTKPRLFRLAEDEAVINRMGFNNGGQTAAIARLSKARASGGIIGINVGANKDSTDRIADYVEGVKAMAPYANYLTVNISSPNTPGLRGLQDKGELRALLEAVNAARPADGPPLFLKLAPDLDRNAIDDVAGVVAGRVDALIIGNTTISRPPLLSRHAGETGGLSGAPLAPLARQTLAAFRVATGGNMPLIAAGGIDSGAEAYARIRAGASMVQLYSALVYHGPGLARRIANDLLLLLRRDGLSSIRDAIGADCR